MEDDFFSANVTIDNRKKEEKILSDPMKIRRDEKIFRSRFALDDVLWIGLSALKRTIIMK